MDDEQVVDVNKILAHESEEEVVSYNQKDLLLYAVGLGISELKFVYELDDEFAAFPLYPVVLPFKGTCNDVVPFPPPSALDLPDGMPNINPGMILHGEQSLELLAPLNPEGAELNSKRRILSFLDKGKGTLMETETILSSVETGQVVARLISGAFIRGLTGFQGKGRQMPPAVRIPDREPDATDEFTTCPTQTHIYRLSGDYNPLHVDPEMAQGVGFEQPILHGLCSMGIAAYAVYKHFGNGNPQSITSIRVRFAKPCFPGETLVTRMWKSSNNTVIFQTIAKERNIVVLNAGQVQFGSFNRNAKL